MTEKWVVSLGDGTWVLLDELPIVALVPEEELDKIDEFPVDCMEFNHIHIKELVENNPEWTNALLTERV